MHSVAWPEGEVGHGVAILVEDRLQNFVVPAPGVDDQKIKSVPATTILGGSATPKSNETD